MGKGVGEKQNYQTAEMPTNVPFWAPFQFDSPVVLSEFGGGVLGTRLYLDCASLGDDTQLYHIRENARYLNVGVNTEKHIHISIG